MEDKTIHLSLTTPPFEVPKVVEDKNVELFTKLREKQKEKERIDAEYKAKVEPVKALILKYEQIASLLIEVHLLESSTGQDVVKPLEQSTNTEKSTRENNTEGHHEEMEDLKSAINPIAESKSNFERDYKPGERGALRYAIVKAVRDSDDFMTNDEIIKYLDTQFAEHNFDRKNVITGLKDARQVELKDLAPDTVVFGITIGDSQKNAYLHGLRSFLVDPNNPTGLKESYKLKFERKLRSLGPLIGDDTQESLFNLYGPEKKLASGGAEANAKSDTDLGEKPSVDAAGNITGFIGQLNLPDSD